MRTRFRSEATTFTRTRQHVCVQTPDSEAPPAAAEALTATQTAAAEVLRSGEARAAETLLTDQRAAAEVLHSEQKAPDK